MKRGPSASVKLAVFSLLIFANSLPLSAQTWERLGPPGGMVISLASDSGDTLYLGTNDGHVFVSQDRGGHWSLRGRVGLRTDAIVAQLAVNPREPKQVFAAVWFQEAGAGGGVFCSEDGGSTWKPSGLQGEAVRALEFSPSQAGLLVAGTRSGVFRSVDSGETWERISPAGDPELRNLDSVAIDPANPQIIYAGTYHLPWKTTDGGRNWSSIATGLIDDSDIMSIRVDARNPARVYLSACSGIYRSENRGDLWIKMQGIPYAARRTQAIVQDPQHPGTLFAATTEGLWVTRDDGESWLRTTPDGWVVNGVAVLPAAGEAALRIVIGTEAQGVMISEDGGKTFMDSNRGFAHQIAMQMVGDPDDPSRLLLLLQSNGLELLESRDSGRSWSSLPPDSPRATGTSGWSVDRISRIYGGPWGWFAELSNGTLWLASGESGGWKPWKATYALPARFHRGVATKSLGVRRVAVRSRGILIFSGNYAYLPAPEGVLKCTRQGSCELLSAFASAKSVSALWVSPDGQVFAVASERKIGFSRDAGKSALWRSFPPGLPEVKGILGDSHDGPGFCLATSEGLYVTPDAGEHWTLSRDGLPAGVVEHEWRTSSGLLATLQEGGVYLSPDGMGNWSRLDQDAERSRFSGMAETKPGEIVLGSQSEGVLRLESHVAHWFGPAVSPSTSTRRKPKRGTQAMPE